MRQEGPAEGPALRIGPHQYRVEGDLFRWQPCALVLPEHARSVIEVVLEIHKRHGYVLYLIDARQGKPLGPDTRRIVIDSLRPLKDALAISAFGMSWLLRGSGSLLVSAARMVMGINIPLKFASTEAEARAFLEEYRDGRTQARNRTIGTSLP